VCSAGLYTQRMDVATTLYGQCTGTYGAGVTDESQDMATFSVRCNRRLWNAVKAIARRRGESISVVIRRALVEYEEAEARRHDGLPHAS
jgi:Ribbon-helix-helix protein, copG family